MKKMINLLIIICLVFSTNMLVFAQDTIKVSINGRNCEYDVPPMNINGRVLLPIRAIFESLGAEVTWDNDSKTATGINGETVVVLQANNKEATVNGKKFELDVAATIIDNRVLAPARFVAESMGASVTWDGVTKTVIITTKDGVIPSDETTASIKLGNTSGNYANGGWVNHADGNEYFVSSQYWDAYDLYQAKSDRTHTLILA